MVLPFLRRYNFINPCKDCLKFDKKYKILNIFYDKLKILKFENIQLIDHRRICEKSYGEFNLSHFQAHRYLYNQIFCTSKDGIHPSPNKNSELTYYLLECINDDES